MADSHRAYHLGRRALLRRLVGGGLGALGVGVAACAPTAPSPTSPPAAKPPAPAATTAAKPAATTAPAPAATAAPPKPKTLQKARVGVITNIFENAYVWVGAQKGFFSEEGVDLEIINFQDGSLMQKALLAGELETGDYGPGPVFIAVEAGAALKTIGLTKPKTTFVMYARKGINTLKDLEGKSVGTGGPKSLLDTVVRALFQLKGVDASKVNFVNIGPITQIFQAVQTGKVDAGPSATSFLPIAEKDPNLTVLAHFADSLPNYCQLALNVTDKMLKDNEQLLLGVMIGWARSHRYGLEKAGGDEAVKWAVEKFAQSLDAAQLTQDYTVKQRTIDPDLDVPPEAVKYMQDVAVLVEDQKSVLPFERVANRDLSQKLVAKISKYTWR